MFTVLTHHVHRVLTMLTVPTIVQARPYRSVTPPDNHAAHKSRSAMDTLQVAAPPAVFLCMYAIAA